MIVHELITNAARHAFAGEKGEIQVELLRVGSVSRAKCRTTDRLVGMFVTGAG